MPKQGSDGLDIQLGGVNLGDVVIDTKDATEKLIDLQRELKKVTDTLSTLARGHNVSAYWNEQAASIENVIKAAEDFRKEQDRINAEGLVKAMNAFSAWNPDDDISKYFDRIERGADGLIAKAKGMARGLDSAFSVESLRNAFDALNQISGASGNASEIIEKLNQGDVSSLTEQIERLERQARRTGRQIEEMQSQIEKYESGGALRSLEDAARRSQKEFADFLSSIGFTGSDIDPDDSWGNYAHFFESIADGSMTAKEAIADFKREFPYMFKGADSSDLQNILSKLEELGSELENVREKINTSTTTGGSGGIAGALESGATAAEDAKESVIEFVNAFSGASDQLERIASQLEEIARLVNEINDKNFSIQNVFQAGGGETEAANQLRVYREEATALNQYLTSLRNTITAVANQSRGMTGVLLTMTDQFDALASFDPERMTSKIGSSDTAGKIDAITAQLKSYRDAMLSIADAMGKAGIDIVLPDASRVEAATKAVADFDSQSKQMAETFAKEAAEAAAASSGIQKVSSQAAELKMGVPEAGASFEEINAQLDAINNILPVIGENIKTAFDFSGAEAGVKNVHDVLSSLLADQKIRLTVDESALAPLRKAVEDTVNQVSQDVSLKINKVEFTPAALRKVKQATAMFGAAGELKFDETSLSSLSQTIQEAITKASSNIKLTLSNVQLSAKARQNLIDEAQKAASGGAGKTTNGTSKRALEDETAAIEKNIDAWMRDHEAWREANEQRAREAGWVAADALKKEEAAKEAAAAKAEAAAQKEEAASIKAGNAYFDQADKAEAASKRIEEASDRAARASESRLDRLNMEVGQLSPDLSLRSTDVDIVNAYTNAWKRLMIELSAVNSLTGEDLVSGLSNLTEHTNDLKVMRSEFNQLSQIITSIEKLDPSVALKTTDVGQLKQYGDMWTQVSDRIREAIELIKHGTMPDMNGIRMLMDQLTKAKDAYNAVYDARVKLESIKPDTLKDLGVEQIEAYKEKWAELSEMINQTLANIASGEPIDIKGIQSALSGLQTMRDEYNQLYDMQQKLAAVSPDKLGGALPEDKVDTYTQAYNNLTEAIGRALAAEGADRTSAMAQIRATADVLMEEANAYKQVAADAANAQAVQQRVSKLTDRIDLYLQKNGKLSASSVEELNKLRNSLNGLDMKGIQNAEKEFQSFERRIKIAGEAGQSFFQQMKAGWSKFGGWSLVSRSFMAVIRTFKQAVTAVKEVDAAMTELKKVSDETASGYEKMYESMVSQSAKVGASLSDVINSTASFMRLGFNAAEALDLSEAANVYFNVGDQLDSITEATESIISTMKAFNLSAEQSMTIVDKFNDVGNNFAISSSGIGEALQRSAAALSAAGNSIDESIGLIVAANDVIQNPEAVGENYNMRPAA